MPDLLLEVGCEELPAAALELALAQLSERLPKALQEERLAHGAIRIDGTPRRIALIAREVAARQADLDEIRLGPPLQLGRNPDGSYSQAALGFARKLGAAPESLFEHAGKLALAVHQPGEPAMSVLPRLLEPLLAAIAWKKSMSWGDGRVTHRALFARPVQWILALFDGGVLPLRFADVVSGDVTFAHRFHAPAPVRVTGVEHYLRVLAAGDVVLERAERRRLIAEGSAQLAASQGGRVREDAALLALVADLVEKPFPVLASFEQRFLDMPPELLVSEMREHQKYFAVEDGSGRLLPAFIVVAGSRSSDPAALAAGNARVLHARFEDGAFYFTRDLERSLESRLADLEQLVFHRELGSMRQKVERLERLVGWLGSALALPDELRERAVRAARLCKADLASGAVNEFPELQGIMGRVYAAHDSEHPDVALALEEHYAPRTAAGELPRSQAGALVGIADRIDSIAGMLAIGKGPSASADPFALRRAAIGLLRIALAQGYRFSLSALIEQALVGYREQGQLAGRELAAAARQVLEFVQGRLRSVLSERMGSLGLRGAEHVVDAALAARAGIDDLPDVEARLIALVRLRAGDPATFSAAAASFKRVASILDKARSERLSVEHQPTLLQQPAELALHAAVDAARASANGGASVEARERALLSVAELQPQIARFFDDVLVMSDDHALRSARLGLLARIEDMLLEIADFSKLQSEA